MDKIGKVLQKLTSKEKFLIKEIIKALQSERFDNLDIKKLKGYDDVFRVRRGKIRIVYRLKRKDLIIVRIDRRSKKTYKF